MSAKVLRKLAFFQAVAEHIRQGYFHNTKQVSQMLRIWPHHLRVWPHLKDSKEKNIFCERSESAFFREFMLQN